MGYLTLPWYLPAYTFPFWFHFVKFFLRISYMNTVFTSFTPPFLLSSSLYASYSLSNSWLLLNHCYICIYVCTHMYTYNVFWEHNLPRPFGVAHMYICLGLTIYGWINYQGTPPWKKTDFPSLSSQCCSLSKGGNMWNSPIPTAMSTVGSITQAAILL